LDCHPLYYLRKLEELILWNTSIADLTFVTELRRLRRLDLTGTPVRDIAQLGGLMNLSTLDLTDTPVSDLSGMETLTNLTNLHLVGTRIREVSPLRHLRKLRRVCLPGARVSDLTPLMALDDLHRLEFVGAQTTPTGARALLERIVANAEASGAQSYDVAVALSSLGGALLSEGESAEAERLFERALGIMGPLFGTDPYDIAGDLPHDPPPDWQLRRAAR
jgi:Leucine-rich repeat (LRR) protein